MDASHWDALHCESATVGSQWGIADVHKVTAGLALLITRAGGIARATSGWWNPPLGGNGEGEEVG